MTPEWKGEVPTLDLLNRMVTDPLPLGLRSGPVEPFFQRDIYFDSADWTLRRRGVSCRFRIRVDDRRILTLRTVGRWEGGVPLVLPQTFEADVAELEGAQALVGTSDPARRLRSLIDPALLLPRIQFETERRLRYTRAGWFSRGRYAVVYDVVTVRSHQMAQAFEELKLRELARGRPGLDRLARALQQQYGLRPLLVGKADRAAKLLRDLESGDHGHLAAAARWPWSPSSKGPSRCSRNRRHSRCRYGAVAARKHAGRSCAPFSAAQTARYGSSARRREGWQARDPCSRCGWRGAAPAVGTRGTPGGSGGCRSTSCWRRPARPPCVTHGRSRRSRWRRGRTSWPNGGAPASRSARPPRARWASAGCDCPISRYAPPFSTSTARGQSTS